MKERNVDISIFKKMQNDMIAKSSNSWNEYYGRRSIERLKDYSLEEIEQIINGSSIIPQQKLSRNYFNKDGFYKRIIFYYASILKYAGILIPNPAFGQKLSNQNISKRYYQALNYIDRLKLPQLFTRFAVKALIDGAYYGVIQSLDKNQCVVIDLPSGYCCSRFKDFNGNDIVEFDLNYFYTINDSMAREQALNSYPSFISQSFKKYDEGKLRSSWITLPIDIGICFSFSEDGRPPFLNVIPSTIQYDESVDTERERELEEIRKILVQKIPHLQDGQLLFEPDEAVEMHAGAVGMMRGNKNLSILTTYADVDAIVSKTQSENSSNALERMLQNIYSQAGVSSSLFSPTSSQALNTSIINDMSFMMIIVHKFDNFISSIINELFSNSNINFNYKVLPISYYNQSDYITDAFKLAQSGYSYLLPALALDLTQQQLSNIKNLENDVLKLGDLLIPLSSAYTQSASDGTAGRPELKEEEKSQKTIANEESLDNQSSGGAE